MRLTTLVIALAITVATSACGAIGQSSPTHDPLTGVYIIKGGGGALDAVIPLTKAFTARHAGVTWQGLDDVGSDAGIKLVQTGDIDLGFISRDLKPAEVGTVQTLSIGASGTALAVAADNPVAAVTKDQLAGMYTGRITNWRELGGHDHAIRVLLREAGAATRMSVESYVFGGRPPQYVKNVIEMNSYDEIVKAIKSFPDSFGMVSMSAQGFAEPSIRFLSIDGIPATRAELNNGRYPMRRPLHLVYNADPAKLRPAIRAFLDFVKSPDGQAVLDSV